MKRILAIVFVCLMTISVSFPVFAEETLNSNETLSSVEALPQSIGISVGNARELGGYQASDGRTVKHGAFLRTASLATATDEDIERLRDAYHLSVVIDLRMTSEVEAAPDPEIARNLHIGIIDEEAEAVRLEGVSLEGLGTIEKLKVLMEAGVFSDQMYIEWLSSETGKAGYARMFEEIMNLPEGEALLFHCTQGKDRTGVAAMLILSALGVDEDTILADYLLTNTYNADKIESERQMLEEEGVDGQELESYMKAMDEVDGSYMINTLDWMKENYGSVLGYITQELGVTEIQMLRDKFLE